MLPSNDFKGMYSLYTGLMIVYGPVFANEKPMKERDIFRNMRRNVRDGSTPQHIMNANSKNRYNILSDVFITKGVRPVEYVALKTIATISLFMQILNILLRRGTLAEGDVFDVDNCLVHLQGDNIGVQRVFWEKYRVLMTTLPPYSPEFNPTGLVFNTLLQRLSSIQVRHKTVSEMEFIDEIIKAMNCFDLLDVKALCNFCGYKC